jgi:hypothetical protein
MTIDHQIPREGCALRSGAAVFNDAKQAIWDDMAPKIRTERQVAPLGKQGTTVDLAPDPD